MLCIGILSLRLFLHVPNLQGQNAQTVDGPGRALRVQARIGQGSHLAIQVAEVAVYLLHQVRTVLVGVVYAPLQSQSLGGFDMRITDNILQMPLHRVYPALQIKAVLYRVAIIRIADRRIYVVCQMVVANSLQEDFICLFSKSHIVYFLFVWCKDTNNF